MAGQQLAFGEQLGWISPKVVGDPENAAFLRQMARLRHRLRRFFYAGQMNRPPKLLGTIPTVTADWQWDGVTPVTTDAVLTGAWELPGPGAGGAPPERKLALIFVNVSDQPVAARFTFDAAAFGLPADGLNMTTVTAGNESAPEQCPGQFTRVLRFEPHKAWAWIITTPRAAPGDSLKKK